jgi:hypothetical protein
MKHLQNAESKLFNENDANGDGFLEPDELYDLLYPDLKKIDFVGSQFDQ